MDEGRREIEQSIKEILSYLKIGSLRRFIVGRGKVILGRKS